MIPKEKIEDWKQLCKQATPGPYIEFFSHGKVSALMPAGRPGEICSFGEDAVVPNRDARFYRTAREAVPALIEEVEQLRARVEELEKGSNDLCISFDRPGGAGGEYGGKSVIDMDTRPLFNLWKKIRKERDTLEKAVKVAAEFLHVHTEGGCPACFDDWPAPINCDNCGGEEQKVKCWEAHIKEQAEEQTK